MTWQKNFEIRIVPLRELSSCKDYFSQSSKFELSPRFSSRLYNSTAKGYFLMALNYWNVQRCRALLRTWILTFLSWFGEKTLKSGLYFYKKCPPVKIISHCYHTLIPVKDSVYGLITQLQKVMFQYPWIIEMSNHVKHYRGNELIFLSWLGKKLWNPDGTFRRTALL